jgi:hypothetical protein
MLRRLRKLRQRFGIAAPQVAVRTALPWYLRWAALALFSAFAVAGAAWIYDAGRRFAGFDRGEIEQELFAARAELAKLKAELEGLRASANAAEARLAVERSAQAKLAQQLRTLEHEAARLREELAIFEAMATSAAPAPGTLSILRFRVEPDPMPGEYRYRLLLRAPAARRGAEFHGRVELVVSLTEDGRSAMITLPQAESAESAAFRLSFRHFQRLEGSFRVSAKAKVESVQVRVYESGSTNALATRSVGVG